MDEYKVTRSARIFDAGGSDLPLFHVKNQNVVSAYFDLSHRGTNPDYWAKEREYKDGPDVILRVNPSSDPHVREAYAKAVSEALRGKRISDFFEMMMEGHATKIAGLRIRLLEGWAGVLEVTHRDDWDEATIPVIDAFAVKMASEDAERAAGISHSSTVAKNYVDSMRKKMAEMDSWEGKTEEAKERLKSAKRESTRRKLSSMAENKVRQLTAAVAADALPQPLERLDKAMVNLRRIDMNAGAGRAKSLAECARMHEEEKASKEERLKELESDDDCKTGEFLKVTRFWEENSGPGAKLSGRNKWRQYMNLLVDILHDPILAPHASSGKTADQIKDAIEDAAKSKTPADTLLDEFQVLKDIDELAWEIRDIRRYLDRWESARFTQPHPTKSPDFAQWQGASNGIRRFRTYREGNKHVIEVSLEGVDGINPDVKAYLSPDMATSNEFVYWLKSSFNPDGSKKAKADRKKPFDVTVSVKLFFSRRKGGDEADLSRPYLYVTLTRSSRARIKGFSRGDFSRPYVRVNDLGMELSVNRLSPKSILVRSVDDGGPLHGSIRPGDAILALVVSGSDGKPSRKDLAQGKHAAMDNLVGALRYCQPGATMAVVASRAGRELEIQVKLPDRAAALDLNMGAHFIVGEKPGGVAVKKLDLDPKNALDAGVGFWNRNKFSESLDNWKKNGKTPAKRANRALANSRKAGARRLASEAMRFIKSGGYTTLVIEDLTPSSMRKGKNTRARNRNISNWAVAVAIKSIEQACARDGIHLRKKSPAYTSRVCAGCCDKWDGANPLDWRMTWRYLNGRNGKLKYSSVGKNQICPSCGSEVHPDINAGLNILRKHRGTFPYAMADRFNKLTKEQQRDVRSEVERRARRLLKSRMKPVKKTSLVKTGCLTT